MSNNAEPIRMHPDARREQILRVAAETFSRDDYEALSMSAIARGAGVTRALVYHYFPGKDALLEAVLRREGERLLEATRPTPGASTRENLVRALRAYFDHFAAGTGRLGELYAPRATSPRIVWDIAAANHEVQVARILDALHLEDSPTTRLSVGSWLAFVEEAARSSARADIPHDEAIGLCLRTLDAAIGQGPGTVRTARPSEEDS